MTICDCCQKLFKKDQRINTISLDPGDTIYELCDYCQKQLRIIINNHVIMPKKYKGDPNDPDKEK
jgi:hypothetical protein